MNLTMTLVEWVATSVFLILAVLALRASLGRRVSATLRYALWLVVLARLLVPVQLFTSPIAGRWVVAEKQVEQHVTQAPAVPAAPTVGSAEGAPALSAPDPAPGTVPAVPAAPKVPDAPEPPTAPDLAKLSAALGWTWLAGSMAVAAALVASNLLFFRRLRRARTPLADTGCPLRVYVAAGLPSPCLFGLVGPAVYVTPEAAADPAMLRHVLAHEYTHFRHGDHVWNVLRSLALAVHWWDPLVWLAVALSRRDCELACDEGALRRLGDGERIPYGRTLLALLTQKPRPRDLLTCATTMTGGKKSVLERVKRIAHAPKRWVWAAVLAVLAAALVCLYAFASAPKAEPDPAETLGADMDWAELPAELRLYMDRYEDGEPFVRVYGTVDGVELKRGATWSPRVGWDELSMSYPPFSGGIEGMVTARWMDESRTSVSLSTRMMSLVSSYLPNGYWEFAVDLTTGTVTAMDAQVTGQDLQGAVKMYPESISDDEAVKAGRVAAKLLTEAENYYSDNADWDEMIAHMGFSALKGDGAGDVLITGLGDGSATWSRDTSPSKGVLDFDGDLATFCPRVTGRKVTEGSAVWTDESRTGVSVTMNVALEGAEDPDSCVHFSVDLESGAVTERDFRSLVDDYTTTLTDGEMAHMAQIAAKLLTAAEDYSVHPPSPEAGTLPVNDPVRMWFASGAGGWSTALTLHPDGSFEGEYSDSDMGDRGEDYPGGTQYICRFHGRFGSIARETGGSWSMSLEELAVDTGHPVGEEWIEDGVRYIASAPYGMDDKDGEPLKPGAGFVLYTPDAQGYAPGSELYGMSDEGAELYEFWTWWPDRCAFSAEQSTLDCYALRSVETGYGFFGPR